MGRGVEETLLDIHSNISSFLLDETNWTGVSRNSGIGGVDSKYNSTTVIGHRNVLSSTRNVL